MADVYYVKLVTGEQLLTGVYVKNDKDTVLDNPLELTFNETEDGRSYIYLSRYTPFAAVPMITVRNEHVLHMERAMSEAETYYERSLRYCNAKTDKSFHAGVVNANDYVLQLVEDAERPAGAERQPDDMIDHDDMASLVEDIVGGSSKKTLH
jgi:hypothetical protein